MVYKLGSNLNSDKFSFFPMLQMSESSSGWEDLIFIPPGKSHSQHIKETKAWFPGHKLKLTIVLCGFLVGCYCCHILVSWWDVRTSPFQQLFFSSLLNKKIPSDAGTTLKILSGYKVCLLHVRGHNHRCPFQLRGPWSHHCWVY